MRVLMIEDDEELCNAVKASLTVQGMDVDICHDGAEGLEYLHQNIYDVCCLDRMLPHMDGLTLLRKARAAGILTPVLILTALSRIGDRVDGLDAGGVVVQYHHLDGSGTDVNTNTKVHTFSPKTVHIKNVKKFVRFFGSPSILTEFARNSKQ